MLYMFAYFSNVFLAKIAKILEKNSIGRNFWTVGRRKLIFFFKFKEIFRRIQWCDQIGWKMSRLGVVKKVHRITLKTLNRVKHLKIHYQIKFHHILCNSSTDMASLELWSSLLQVLYIAVSPSPLAACFTIFTFIVSSVHIPLSILTPPCGRFSVT